MGNSCHPKNFAAILTADKQHNGRDVFSEAEQLNSMSKEQKAHYESFMAKMMESGGENKKKPSPYDTMTKKGAKGDVKDDIRGIPDPRFHGHPSEMFSKKFYEPVAKKLRAYASKKDGDYSEIRKPVRSLQKALNTVIEQSGNKRELTRALKPYGLTPDTLYDAKKWLEWVDEGGPWKKSKNLQPVIAAAKGVGKAQANFNVLWAAGNVADMTRPFAYFGVSNPKAVIQGIMDTGMNPFKQNKALIKQGIYGSQDPNYSMSNRDPFSWTVTAQKNYVYNIAKRAGVNPRKAMADTIFDYEPWDRPRYDRSPEASLAVDLARYPISEARWHYKTVKTMLHPKTPYKERGQAIASYLAHNMTRAVVFGAPSLVPYMVWQFMFDKDQKKGFSETTEAMGLNQVKIQSRNILNSLGIDASVDMTEYLQPGGGQLGARYQSFKTTADRGFRGTAGAIKGVATGQLDEAGINTLAAASALLNLTGSISALQKFDAVNSTTLTDVLFASAQILTEEMEPGDAGREMLKAILSGKTVKKPEEEKPGQLPKLEGLPKLPKLKAS